MKVFAVSQFKEHLVDGFVSFDKAAQFAESLCPLFAAISPEKQSHKPLKGNVWYKRGKAGELIKYKSNYDTSD